VKYLISTRLQIKCDVQLVQGKLIWKWIHPHFHPKYHDLKDHEFYQNLIQILVYFFEIDFKSLNIFCLSSFSKSDGGYHANWSLLQNTSKISFERKASCSFVIKSYYSYNKALLLHVQDQLFFWPNHCFSLNFIT
jgi:hypothetical protein